MTFKVFHLWLDVQGTKSTNYLSFQGLSSRCNTLLKSFESMGSWEKWASSFWGPTVAHPLSYSIAKIVLDSWHYHLCFCKKRRLKLERRLANFPWVTHILSGTALTQTQQEEGKAVQRIWEGLPTRSAMLVCRRTGERKGSGCTEWFIWGVQRALWAHLFMLSSDPTSTPCPWNFVSLTVHLQVSTLSH